MPCFCTCCFTRTVSAGEGLTGLTPSVPTLSTRKGQLALAVTRYRKTPHLPNDTFLKKSFFPNSIPSVKGIVIGDFKSWIYHGPHESLVLPLSVYQDGLIPRIYSNSKGVSCHLIPGCLWAWLIHHKLVLSVYICKHFLIIS